MEWLWALLTVSLGWRILATGIIFTWLAAYPGFKHTTWQTPAIWICSAISVLGGLICIWAI